MLRKRGDVSLPRRMWRLLCAKLNIRCEASPSDKAMAATCSAKSSSTFGNYLLTKTARRCFAPRLFSSAGKQADRRISSISKR